MIVKGIAPWFGGKRTMAPMIAKQLGKHTQYFEPFCGSMAVLFAKEPSQKETVNDLHGDLINLARVIQCREKAEDLYDRLQRVLFGDDILEQARNVLESEWRTKLGDDPLADTSRAYWYFIACWTSRNGTSGTERMDFQLSVRWTKNGGSPTVRFRHAIESIPAWHERLRNVVIVQRDAFDIIRKFEDCKETAIYVDPPYHAVTRAKKNGAGSRYLHEFHHADGLFGSDHARLYNQLTEFVFARIVVSYYDCPEIRSLYQGWKIIECPRHKHLSVVGGKSGATEAPEILIVNGQPF